MPEYKVEVVDSGSGIGSSVSWKKYVSDVPLEYGNEIVIEADQDQGPTENAPRSLRARVISVDNDALFTSRVTVEPITEN